MSDKIENPPAFACVSGLSTEEGAFLQQGMTLRDYFAAKVMQGVLANPHIQKILEDTVDGAVYAYEIADAMLKERSKPWVISQTK